MKNDPDFIAAYGSIPAFETSEERDQWIDTLGKIMEEINANFDHEMSKYSYPNGPVAGCGVTIDGVLKVGINKSEKVEKPFMDEIYRSLTQKQARWGLRKSLWYLCMKIILCQMLLLKRPIYPYLRKKILEDLMILMMILNLTMEIFQT